MSDVRALEDALEIAGRKLLMREEDVDDLLPEDDPDEIRTMENVAAILVGWNFYGEESRLVGEIENFEPIPPHLPICKKILGRADYTAAPRGLYRQY